MTGRGDDTVGLKMAFYSTGIGADLQGVTNMILVRVGPNVAQLSFTSHVDPDAATVDRLTGKAATRLAGATRHG